VRISKNTKEIKNLVGKLQTFMRNSLDAREQ